MFFGKEKGFTLIELLVVIGIIGLIASITLASLRDSREKGKAANAGGTARNLRLATELYYANMGFYPPDVNRGWDPGFTHPLPFNPDTG
jgi:general secretion pathway protein G